MPRVELVKVDNWPFGSRVLAELAQLVADDRDHAAVSGAHMAVALLAMQPVRRLLGDAPALFRLDAAVSRSLSTTPRSLGKRATWTGPLQRVLAAGQVVTTGALLRSALLGEAGLAPLHDALVKHEGGIAALLDAPKLEELLSAPTAPASTKECGYLAIALTDATNRRHRDLTTRHVVAAGLRTYETLLAKRALPGLGDTGAKVDRLLDREPRRVEGTIRYTPRFVGAVADAIATREREPGFPLNMALLGVSMRDDDSVAFAAAAIQDAITRLAEAAGQSSEP